MISSIRGRVEGVKCVSCGVVPALAIGFNCRQVHLNQWADQELTEDGLTT